jgi:hypothetical protein
MIITESARLVGAEWQEPFTSPRDRFNGVSVGILAMNAEDAIITVLISKKNREIRHPDLPRQHTRNHILLNFFQGT